MSGQFKSLAEVIREAGGMAHVMPVCENVICGQHFGRYEARGWVRDQIMLTDIPEESPAGRPFGRLPVPAGVVKRAPAEAYYRGPQTGRSRYLLEWHQGVPSYRWRCGCGRDIPRRADHLGGLEARWNDRKDVWEFYV